MELPANREFYGHLFDALLESGVTDPRIALYRESFETEKWTRQHGEDLVRARDTVPETEWPRLKNMASLRGVVLAIARLYLTKLSATADHQLAWEMIEAGDQVLNRVLSTATPEEAGSLTSKAAWAVREAIQAVVRRTQTDLV